MFIKTNPFILIIFLCGLSCSVEEKDVNNDSSLNEEETINVNYEHDNLYEFSPFTEPKLIGVEQITGKNDSTEYFTTYLGEIKNSTDKSLYHVVTQFITVQAAIAKHGHSKIIFLNKDKKTYKIYIVDLPKELPIKLKNNELIFKVNDKEKGLTIKEELPVLICIPESSCF